MEFPVCLVIALYALSAVLPIAGLIGLLRTARREAREYAAVEGTLDGVEPSWFQVMAHARFTHNAIPSRPKTIVRDFLYIGVGVLAGAAASIWTLFL